MSIRPLCLLLIAASGAFAGTVNVALNKTVTVTAGSIGGVALSTLVDGVFRPEGTVWTDGTVLWSFSTTPTIQVDLGAAYTIDGAIVQGDDNDTYLLEYFNGSWQTAWAIPTSGGGGMRARPNADQTTQFSFGPINAQLWRVSATGGDDRYSLAEIQLFTNPAPEPSTFFLLAGALGVFGASRLRRRQKD